MARTQLLIEGFQPAELLELAKTTSLLPLFAGKPVCVTYGAATLMGGVRKRGHTLTIEIAVMEDGARPALAKLEVLVKQIAELRDIATIEWKLPATESRVRASAPTSRSGRRRPSRPSR